MTPVRLRSGGGFSLIQALLLFWKRDCLSLFILTLPSGVMFIVIAPIFSLNSVFAQFQLEFGFRGWEAAFVDTVSGSVIFRGFRFQGTTIATI